MEKICVNTAEFQVLSLLGKGKGGYSYLVSDGNNRYVVKQIHHEPCDYYQFGDKLQSEINDYQKLLTIGIRLPKLLAVDTRNERILKEYIEGDTVFEKVKKDEDVSEYLVQIKEMCERLYRADTNIDYFPTNFVVRAGLLYYIDYECNHYMAEWDFENWGIRYWSKTEEFLDYLKQPGTGAAFRSDLPQGVMQIRLGGTDGIFQKIV